MLIIIKVITLFLSNFEIFNTIYIVGSGSIKSFWHHKKENYRYAYVKQTTNAHKNACADKNIRSEKVKILETCGCK